MRQQITVSTWGQRLNGGQYHLDDEITVRPHVDETWDEATKRSLERRTGYQMVTWRADSSTAASIIYQGTLCDPCPGGGWTPRGEVWASIPRS